MRIGCRTETPTSNSSRRGQKTSRHPVLIIGAGIEADIAELETHEERAMFLEDLGLEEAGVAKLIRQAYALLDLQTYFCGGERGPALGPSAVATLLLRLQGSSTPISKGFIRAEVMKYGDFVALGSESAAKEAGKLSVEGKEYLSKMGTSCTSDSTYDTHVQQAHFDCRNDGLFGPFRLQSRNRR